MTRIAVTHFRPVRGLLAILLLALLLLPAAAKAQSAFTTTAVSLRAGPAVTYPSVLVLGPGTPLTVNGCLSGWSWCDVSSPAARGWVAGAYLTSPYQGARVPLSGYGLQLGLPIIAFSLNDYWGRYYRDRPWYRDRDRWGHGGPIHRPPVHRPPVHRPPVHRPPAHRPPAHHTPPHRPPAQHPNRPQNDHGRH